jgi:hypothetical protein
MISSAARSSGEASGRLHHLRGGGAPWHQIRIRASKMRLHDDLMKARQAVQQCFRTHGRLWRQIECMEESGSPQRHREPQRGRRELNYVQLFGAISAFSAPAAVNFYFPYTQLKTALALQVSSPSLILESSARNLTCGGDILITDRNIGDAEASSLGRSSCMWKG